MFRSLTSSPGPRSSKPGFVSMENGIPRQKCQKQGVVCRVYYSLTQCKETVITCNYNKDDKQQRKSHFLNENGCGYGMGGAVAEVFITAGMPPARLLESQFEYRFCDISNKLFDSKF